MMVKVRCPRRICGGVVGDIKRLYPSIREIASSNDTDFLKSTPYSWMYGFGHLPTYVNYSAIWEALYYNGFITKSEYNNNPFPL